ncbi:MAG: universal stress protein [Bacteroidota bacterium]
MDTISKPQPLTTPLSKIIVCLDYSSKDKEVIENTCTISKIAGATEIIFLNVIKEFILPEEVKKEFPYLIDKAIEERKCELSEIVNDSFSSNITKRLIVKQGNITKEILNVATDEKSDLIIMGRNNDGNSVLSARIARRSPCNLLFLPQNRKIKFDKILIPVDFSDYSELSLKIVLQLTENITSTIYLENIISVPSSYRYSGKSFEEFSEILKGHVRKDLDLLLNKFSLNKQKLVPLFTLEKGEKIIDLIWKESKKKKVDMMVMGAKGRTPASALFIGSKAERMIRLNDEIPLMIIRKKGAMAGIIETLKETLD